MWKENLEIAESQFPISCLHFNALLVHVTCYGEIFNIFLPFFTQMTKEFKQKPLTTMNAALQHAGRLLSLITPERAECLAAVAICKDLISWIRETIKGRICGYFSYFHIVLKISARIEKRRKRRCLNCVAT